MNDWNEVHEKARKIVDMLLDDEVKKEVAKKGKAIGQEARKFWRDHHYVPKFFYALLIKKKEFNEKEEKALRLHARMLGIEAVKQAGTANDIDATHARKASFEVDCKSDELRQDWCN